MHRIALLAVALAVAATNAAAAARDTTLALVAYSTPKEAFAKIIPAFQATPAGHGINFTQSYGPSGDQAQAIVAGLPADVVDLSLEPDLDTLDKAGLVDKSWNANAYHGIVTRSVVVFVVRQGNPKHVKDWGDLVKRGVFRRIEGQPGVVLANPDGKAKPPAPKAHRNGKTTKAKPAAPAASPRMRKG